MSTAVVALVVIVAVAAMAVGWLLAV
ncbi:MAG: hypothetical protein FD127_3495, partial [Acidimicrobiaceae bacterium]